MNKQVLKSVLATALMTAGAAQASSISYYLDQSNALPDNANYLMVTIADGLSDAIDFTVQTLGLLAPGSNFGIQKFSFNGPALTAANVIGLPDNWTMNVASSISEFGKYINNEAGKGGGRVDPLTFSIVGIAGDKPEDYAVAAAPGLEFFTAHVAGFTNFGRVNSTYFGGSSLVVPPSSVVPVPAAAWLLISGMVGLVTVSRRRQTVSALAV